MMLCDGDIEHAIQHGLLTIEPYDPSLLQPASLDVRLGKEFLVPGSDGPTLIGPFKLRPYMMLLGHTLETVKVPNNLAVRVEGKSTWGRRGLLVHLTAGFIDPGFCGEVTLELLNVGPDSIELVPGTPIAQLSFHLLSGPAWRPYGSPGLGSHYQGQTGPTAPFSV
jgi:dCTP deaminase